MPVPIWNLQFLPEIMFPVYMPHLRYKIILESPTQALRRFFFLFFFLFKSKRKGGVVFYLSIGVSVIK